MFKKIQHWSQNLSVRWKFWIFMTFWNNYAVIFGWLSIFAADPFALMVPRLCCHWWSLHWWMLSFTVTPPAVYCFLWFVADPIAGWDMVVIINLTVGSIHIGYWRNFDSARKKRLADGLVEGHVVGWATKGEKGAFDAILAIEVIIYKRSAA